jgi:hypothetical protein
MSRQAKAADRTGTAARLLGTRLVAETLGCSAWRVRDLVRDGVLTPVRFGQQGKFRFRVEDIARLVGGS